MDEAEERFLRVIRPYAQRHQASLPKGRRQSRKAPAGLTTLSSPFGKMIQDAVAGGRPLVARMFIAKADAPIFKYLKERGYEREGDQYVPKGGGGGG